MAARMRTTMPGAPGVSLLQMSYHHNSQSWFPGTATSLIAASARSAEAIDMQVHVMRP